ncbi:hypothetical protein GPECTOR_10g914 [Gonium pectorale]|uniref:Uncharacterized protein n=1 Tax=Gonium pectorale TaxID=33097 RepID=A0A150GRA5_GONPE|nr:hypothetical protein GPECTOR_10g914 [Gonium pectorale]|eukprot:KXZ52282.1 hypothetical protein GPECTOR_10g914 [Gonium pectorale]
MCANRFGSCPDVSLEHVLIEERPISGPDELMRSVRQLEAMLEREAAAAGPGAELNAAAHGGQQQQGGRRQVRLVVIDSVARVFRDTGEGDGGEPQVHQLQRRTAQLFTLSTLLKHGLAVLLTNQIMDDVNSETGALEVGLPSTLRALQQPAPGGGGGGGPGGSRPAALVSSGRRVLPALGLAWANCVNCRLFVARHEGWQGSVIRTLQVVFAPHLPYSYCCFQVTHDGVWGVGDDGEPAAPQSAAASAQVPLPHRYEQAAW